MWAGLDMLIWFNYDYSPLLMFAWSNIEIMSLLLFVLAYYFSYVFIYSKAPGTKSKIILTILYLPVVFFASTSLNLTGYDAQECIAFENSFFANYILVVKIILSLGILYLFTVGIRSQNINKKRLVVLAVGMLSFIFSFLISGIIAGITENYLIEIYGLAALVVFIISLAKLVIMYGEFNLKLFRAQIFVVGLVALVASQFSFIQNPINRFLTAITLIGAIFFGWQLVRSVKKEISQRERIEKLAHDLEEANSKLRELDEMKSEFLSLASHQLRSPLTAMKGYSSMMLEGDYGEMPLRAKEAVRAIFTSSQNLINIVNDFLDISRIEQGRMIYQKNPFDLIKSARDVVISLEPNIRKAGLDLVIDVPKNFEAVVKGDETKIKQVISNLIDNAVKYTVHGSIVISAHVEKGKARIEITDTGLGLEKEEIAKLFTKFMRMKDAYKTNVTGTGLGLYIAKKMIEAHGGFIGATSKGRGQGSTFWFELPTVN
jgi:signal transduction histidine kinase